MDRRGDPGVAERRREVVIAGHRGDTAIARQGLTDEAADVRVAAIGALARCGGLDAGPLGLAISDTDPTVRRRAAETVAGLGADAGAVTAEVSLLGLLSDADATVVETAAWACGERDPAEPGAVEALSSLATGHSDALVREAAAAALGSIGDPAGLGAVLAACRDKATVRRRAVLALAPFSGPEVDAAVARAADDRDWQVRQAAELLRS